VGRNDGLENCGSVRSSKDTLRGGRWLGELRFSKEQQGYPAGRKMEKESKKRN